MPSKAADFLKFRLKLGMIPTLGLCSALGLVITTVWNPWTTDGRA
jgi:hypothetical protein